MSAPIVLGYDGTEGSQAALDAALGLAAELGSAVHLVFSFSVSRLGGELRDLDAAIAERGEVVLAEGRARAEGHGVEVTSEHLAMEPAEGLIDAAERIDARMLVVGSYGERPLKSALVGSTPTRLLHLSERPVLVVRLPD